MRGPDTRRSSSILDGNSVRAVERILLREIQLEQGWLSDLSFYSGGFGVITTGQPPVFEKGIETYLWTFISGPHHDERINVDRNE
ncbi:MAG: hypothetical protein ACXADX_18840 [Candidatus Hodarchaeales archaeon]|jgi:hypothetical protein